MLIKAEFIPLLTSFVVKKVVLALTGLVIPIRLFNKCLAGMMNMPLLYVRALYQRTVSDGVVSTTANKNIDLLCSAQSYSNVEEQSVPLICIGIILTQTSTTTLLRLPGLSDVVLKTSILQNPMEPE